jgi:hydroxymethylpyrimidine pyrophosphatase-like HAD family hydrolase
MLQQAGIIFGVATGRPPKGLRILVELLPHLRFIAGFNGAVIVSRDFSVSAENLLSVHVANQIAQFLLEHNLDVWLYTDRDWFIRDQQAYRVAREQATVQLPPIYLDIANPKANKGEVVHLASSFLEVSPRQIATIGDMANDISMFRNSGVSIEMGNASREVQEAATFVTASGNSTFNPWLHGRSQALQRAGCASDCAGQS